MPEPRIVAVPMLFLAQTLLVLSLSGVEHAPAPPSLATFPSELPEWRQVREDVIAPDMAAQLNADQLLSRTYVRTAGGSIADVFVAWFQSQRSGRGQPHSPKVCLPAVGWVPEETGTITLDTADGPITVNQYIVVNNGERNVVLYWYQGPRRVTAGEWEAKLWLIADAVRYKRTDTALVRIIVPSIHGGDRAAIDAAARFARTLYPLLRLTLPN